MTVIPFSYKNTERNLVRTSQRLDVESRLHELLEQVKNGELVGIWYLVDSGNGTHRYGFAGSYAVSPDAAFIPACKSIQALSCIIGPAGLD